MPGGINGNVPMGDSIDNGNSGFGGASADFGGSVEASASGSGIGGGNAGGANGLGSGDGSGGGGTGSGTGGSGTASTGFDVLGLGGFTASDPAQMTLADVAILG